MCTPVSCSISISASCSSRTEAVHALECRHDSGGLAGGLCQVERACAGSGRRVFGGPAPVGGYLPVQTLWGLTQTLFILPRSVTVL